MKKEELEAMIPSEYVRNYVLETGWIFTDGQKAALLVHSGLTLKEKHSYLWVLKESTTDQNLKQQIIEYLNKSEMDFQAFKENNDKSHIYILKVMNEDISYTEKFPDGYFFDWEMACEYGKKEKQPFVVEKHLVGDKKFLGKYLNSEYYDYPAASLGFNNDGEADYFDSQEVCHYSEKKEGFDYYQYFWNAFYEVPNPFEKGDIVRLAGRCTDEKNYGIVATSQEAWQNNLVKYRSDEWKQEGILLEWSDINIMVEFLNEDGTFSHTHVNPIYLERYQPKEDRQGSTPMDHLLMSASLLHRGEGSLDDLYFNVRVYRESQRSD